MDGYAFSPRDVSDHFFSADGTAALGTINQEIVESLDLKLGVGPEAEYPFDDCRYLRFFFRRMLLHAFRNQAGHDLLCGYLAVTDCGEKVFNLAVTVVRKKDAQLVALEHFLYALFVLPRFL